MEVWDIVNFPAGFLVTTVFGVVGVWLIASTRNHRETMRLQVKLFLCAYLSRIALSFIIYVLGLSKTIGDEDGMGWYYGYVVSQKWHTLSLLDLPGALAEA